MAACASLSPATSTKPNPRDCPVTRSVMTRTPSTSTPALWKAALTLSSVEWKAKLPTYSRLLILEPPDARASPDLPRGRPGPCIGSLRDHTDERPSADPDEHARGRS